MLNLQPWCDYCNTYVTSGYNYGRNDKDYNISILNIMTYVLNEVVGDAIKRYLISRNVKEEHLHRVKMKNEFIFSTVLIGAMKNYSSVKEYQEGVPMYSQVDISGFDFNKAGTNKELRKPFKDILVNHIMTVSKINVSTILTELYKIQKMIEDSLNNKETRFLSPMKIKPLNNYSEPYSLKQVKAAYIWNTLCENQDDIIQVYDSFVVLETTLNDKKELEKFKHKFPNEYAKIESKIFNNSNKDIAKMKLGAIAIPMTYDKIPECFHDFIDSKTIVEKAMSPCNQFLKPLQIDITSIGTNSIASNIISF